MNLDDADWMNSRLAMNVYKMAKEKEVPDQVLDTLLQGILKLNPFFTDAWYTVFERRGEDLAAAMSCIDDIYKAIPDSSRVANLWKRKKTNSKMGRASRNYKDRLNNQAFEYTDTLSSAMIELAMKKPLPTYDKRGWEKVLTWMRSAAKKSIYPDKEQGYQIALAKTQGYKPIVNSVDHDFKEIVRHLKSKSKNRRPPKKKPEEMMTQLTLEINAAVMVLPPEESVPWLRKMIDDSPPNLQFKRKDNGAKITEFYDCLTAHYIRLADSVSASEIRELVKKQEKEFIENMKGKDE